jgi:hypothetical protein
MHGECMRSEGLATAPGAVLADSFHRARLRWPIFTYATLITGPVPRRSRFVLSGRVWVWKATAWTRPPVDIPRRLGRRTNRWSPRTSTNASNAAPCAGRRPRLNTNATGGAPANAAVSGATSRLRRHLASLRNLAIGASRLTGDAATSPTPAAPVTTTGPPSVSMQGPGKVVR